MRITKICAGVLFISLTLLMCGKEKVEITTSSADALKLYKEGVNLAEKFYEEEAIKKFQSAIELDSTFVMAHYYLSRVYQGSGNFAEAKASIVKAAKHSGTTTPMEWKYVAAWEKRIDQNLAEAIHIYKDILKEYPNDTHTLLVIGKTYRLMKNYTESINALKKLIELRPLYAPTYNQLGYAYKEMGEYEQALDAFTKYAELTPDEPNPHDSLGDMYRSKGEYEKAIAAYKKALEVKPNFYTSYRNLGLSYLAFGEYDKAQETYSKYLKVVSDRELKRDAYLDLVQLCIAKGQYNKALQYADEALELSVTNFRKSSAIATKGQIYCLKNNCSAALKQINTSFTIFPDAIWAREGRGMVFIKQQKYGEALSEAEKMLSLIEEYGLEAYQSNYNALMGKIAAAQGFYDEAIMYFNDAMKYDIFDHVSNRVPLARACFQKQDYQKAIEVCRQIFGYNKNHGLTHLLLAQVYEKQSKDELAIAEYNKFLTIWKDADQDISEILLAKKTIK